jgi:hypothetical protein
MAVKTEEEIVEDLFEHFNEQDGYIQESFKSTKKENLIGLHHTLGRHIRNEYKLWDRTWVPLLDQYKVDVSPDHPDAISQRIIEKLHEKVNNV